MRSRDYLMMKNPPESVSTYRDGVHNARIDSATLDIEDRGVLIGSVGFVFGGGWQGMGGYGLEDMDGPSLFCGTFIAGILWATGVGEWGKLEGTPCRILKEGGLIVAVGHLTEDRWFSPRDAGRALREAESTEETTDA